MPDPNLYVVDAREWFYSLGELFKLGGIEGLQIPTEEVMDNVLLVAIRYPPPPPLDYVRTYFMENSWRGRLQLSDNILGVMDSRGVDYVRLVMDEEKQTVFHGNPSRWGNLTIQDHAKTAVNPAEKIFARYAEKVLKPPKGLTD